MARQRDRRLPLSPTVRPSDRLSPQLNNEPRPAPGRLLIADLSAMVFDRLAHQGESQAGAPRFCGDVGFEQPIADLRRYARAVVAYHDPHGAVTDWAYPEL